ncbi:hypothetical protein TRAPUB_11088 [Trametes pubescens]|uniref:Uncharacterized protein n=1 Tax=Trametes pubescens TaxID=154538 RepID=A0A1M2VXX0_TRAPU|nr:hypothetical protein TRAPUB_11088 [Trametes pubescens]
MATHIPLFHQKCNYRLAVVPHMDHPDILQHVSIKAVHPTQGGVGEIRALQIRRDWCRGDFFDIMDDESDELFSFASTLFDKYGRLRKELIENAYLRGTGVWGRELDDGVLLYIFDINIKENFRRQGVASHLLQELVLSTAARDANANAKFFAWPLPTIHLDNEDQWRDQREIARALFSQNHFRRVGRTDFVAYVPQAAHPSRLLPNENDVGIYHEPFDTNTPFGPAHITTVSLLSDGTCSAHDDQAEAADTQMQATYPLHHAIRAKKNSEDAIKGAYTLLPALVRERDDHGFTPLHAAVSATNLAALQTLLSLPAISNVTEDLHSRENIMGRTPLELCKQEMRDAMERAERAHVEWEGHSTDTLRIAFLLGRASGHPSPLPEDAYIVSRKWGCTCGRCTAGWLSARMQYRLMSKHCQSFVIENMV